MSQSRDIAIVGPGRIGQALGRLLAICGFRIGWVAGRRPRAARAAVRFMTGGAKQSLILPVPLDSPALAEARVILITTSDAAVEPVARGLAHLHRDWRGRIVLHTCGSLAGSGRGSPLECLRRCGASTGSLHPFQTVPSLEVGGANLIGTYWGLDGDPAALKVAKRWVKRLLGVAFPVRSSMKTLYHASAFLVSPSLVALMDRSERLCELAGVPRRIARPMLARFAEETAKNFARRGAAGGRGALSGPALRGDWGTLRRHLVALGRQAPEAVPLYRALARDMVRLAGRRPPRGLF